MEGAAFILEDGKRVHVGPQCDSFAGSLAVNGSGKAGVGNRIFIGNIPIGKQAADITACLVFQSGELRQLMESAADPDEFGGVLCKESIDVCGQWR